MENSIFRVGRYLRFACYLFLFGCLTAQAQTAPGSFTSAATSAEISWMSQTYCNTVGYVIVQLTGSWTCSRGIPLNVTWYGVIGDNTTDTHVGGNQSWYITTTDKPETVSANAASNATAVTNAYNALANAGGGVLYFPAGSFYFNSFPVINVNSVYIKGSGMGATNLITTANSSTMIQFLSVAHNGISDLTLASSGPLTGGMMIYVNNSSVTNIENVRILSPYNGVYVDNPSAGQTLTKMTNLLIEGNCGNVGVALGVNTPAKPWVNEVFISNSTIVGCQNSDVYMASVDGVYINQLSAFMGGQGITFNPSAGSHVSHVSITNSSLDTATGAGLFITASTNGMSGSINISNSFFNSNGYGIFVAGASNLKGLNVTNSYFEANSLDGVNIQGAYGGNRGAQIGNLSGESDITFTNNFFCNNSTGGPQAAAGFQFNNATGLIFQGNTAGHCGILNVNNNQSYGIVIGGNTDKVLVANNRFPANVVGPMAIVTGNSHVNTQVNNFGW